MRFREFKDSDEKWVQPFSDKPFRARMRRVPEAETNRIFDKNKIYPSSPKNTMAKLTRASDEIMVASITEWESPETVGLVDEQGNPAPCDTENKLRLDNIRVEYERDGEDITESLYGALVRGFSEESGEELKN